MNASPSSTSRERTASAPVDDTMLSQSRLSTRRTKASSFISSYPVQIFSACLSVAIVATSIAVIAYTAASLNWINNYYGNGNGPVTLLDANYSSITGAINGTWTNDVEYNAWDLKLKVEHAQLAAASLGISLGLLLLATPFLLRNKTRTIEFKVLEKVPGKKTRTLELSKTTAVIALDAIIVLTFLVTMILVHPHDSYSPWDGWDSLPDHHIDRVAFIGPYADETVESWNCWLYWNMDVNARNPSRTQISGQCRNARKSRYLMIPLLALALVRLSLRPMGMLLRFLWEPIAEFLEWRRHTREMREGKGTELNSARKKQADDGESGRDEIDGLDEVANTETFIAELPAGRMSRVEMDEDAAVTEMPGAEGGKEMDAGIAAAEKDAGSKS